LFNALLTFLLEVRGEGTESGGGVWRALRERRECRFRWAWSGECGGFAIAFIFVGVGCEGGIWSGGGCNYVFVRDPSSIISCVYAEYVLHETTPSVPR
jgi:hypothetical protein